MSYLLDTNVVSELRRVDADPAVVRWATAARTSDHYLSAVTLLELELGVLRVERRDTAQGVRLRSWLDQVVLQRYGDRVLPVDATVARRAARLHVPDPRPDRDAMIGATALVHGLTVVTRNVRDFEPLGVRVLNPWEA